MHTRFFTVVGLGAIALGLACFLFLQSCTHGGGWANPDRTTSPDGKPVHRDGSPLTPRERAAEALDGQAKWVGRVAVALFVLSALTLIGSFIVPQILTRLEAIAGFAGAFALSICQYVLLAYGQYLAELAFWVGIILLIPTGVAVGYPYYKIWRRRVGLDPALPARGDIPVP